MKKGLSVAVSLSVSLAVCLQFIAISKSYADDNLGIVVEHVMSNDGKIVAFTESSVGVGTLVDTVTAYNSSLGKVIFSETFNLPLSRISLSPNGKFLGFLHQTIPFASSFELRIVDLRNGQTLLVANPNVGSFVFSGDSKYVVFSSTNDIFGTGQAQGAVFFQIYRYNIKTKVTELITEGGPTGPNKEPITNRTANVVGYLNKNNEFIIKVLQ